MRRRKVLAALALPALPLCALAAGDPYRVEVWADALFGIDGRLQRLDVPEADAYPAAFVERLRLQLAKARIPPVQDDTGAAATFRTGVVLVLEVTPGADEGQVRILGLQVAPLPLKRYLGSSPDNLPGDGLAQIKLRCTVGVDGRCSNVTIESTTAGSESFRRWGIVSMQGWVFAPQEVNGKPVPGEFTQTLALQDLNSRPTEFRRFKH